MKGRADPINRGGGGAVRLYGLGFRGHVRSCEETAAYFRALAGLTGETRREA
jgi:poly(3-hydroxybutyrate) depolymerase